jgi:hypothetical protein
MDCVETEVTTSINLKHSREDAGDVISLIADAMDGNIMSITSRSIMYMSLQSSLVG